MSVTTSAPASTIRPGVAAALDAVLIVVFAAIGRQAHAEHWSGVLITAAPFLIGAAHGWAVWWIARRSAPTTLTGGVLVWLCTVVGGMLVRMLTGQGTALPFVIVSLISTAVVLLGWRALAHLVVRRRR